MPLTHTKINKLKPSDKCTPSRPDKHSHAHGLQLWVRHTGNKVWYSAYRFHGKQQSLQLGKYPALSLQDAIRCNIDIKQLLIDGIDPKNKQKVNNQKKNHFHSFDMLAQEWYAERRVQLAHNTFNRNYSAYKRDVQPIIGNMNVKDISPPDILVIGKTIAQRGANEMARRTVREVSQIFKHAIRQGLILYNPATNISEAIPIIKTQHHNRLSFQNLPSLLADIDNYSGHILIKYGLQFICYTFLRTGEVRFLEWQDIDFKDKNITLPAHKMKARRKHIVPLSSQVIALLKIIKSMKLSNQYVFYNTNKQQPFSSHAFIKALYHMGYQGTMTVHGFRGIASTKLHEMGYMHEAIELQLAHDKENKISKAYDGSMHLQYREKMMSDYANLIDESYTTHKRK